MLSDKAKELFARLDPEYLPIAVKFCYSQPDGYPRATEKQAFCEFLKKAQDSGEGFFTTVENDSCDGKEVLGMVPKPPMAASGLLGVEYGAFKSAAPNAKLHHDITTLTPGAVNFVLFCPVAKCDFDPDLILCMMSLEKAYILMRASSYISGDLWESKTSHVLSCAWMYSYPYISGKVNYGITGMYHGMRRRKLYPAGLFYISIPFNKIYEIVQALDEMPWELLAMKEDAESREKAAAIRDRLSKLSPLPHD